MPVLHECTQRSEAWERAKLGIPTSSCFHMIVTPGGKESEQWRRFAYHLLAERYLGRTVGSYTSPWMERGMELESDAVAWYEFHKDVDTQLIGLITDDEGKIGCSPDRLVGEDGLVELKCPAPATQIEYLLTGSVEKKYKPQLQGQLYVSERQWVDIIAFHPELPRTAMRVERDEKYIELLANQLRQFNRFLDGISEKLCPDWRKDREQSTPIASLSDALQTSLEIVP